MSVIDVDAPPRKPSTPLKPATDRVTRERAEHPDRLPRDSAPHPVTSTAPGVHRPRSEDR